MIDGRNTQGYPVDAGLSQGFTLGHTLFLLYTKNIPDDVTCNIAICADDTTFCSKCDCAPKLEYDLLDTLG